MSGYTSAYLVCNGRVSRPDPRPDLPCPAKVEGGEQSGGELVFPRTVAEARKLARKLGWTFVRYPGKRARSMDSDFCPDHQDQAQAAASEWGVKVTRPVRAGAELAEANGAQTDG